MITATVTVDYTIEKYGRFWAVYDSNACLVCLTVYKRGAIEVIRRLRGEPDPIPSPNPFA